MCGLCFANVCVHMLCVWVLFGLCLVHAVYLGSELCLTHGVAQVGCVCDVCLAIGVAYVGCVDCVWHMLVFMSDVFVMCLCKCLGSFGLCLPHAMTHMGFVCLLLRAHAVDHLGCVCVLCLVRGVCFSLVIVT